MDEYIVTFGFDNMLKIKTRIFGDDLTEGEAIELAYMDLEENGITLLNTPDHVYINEI